MKQLNTHIQVGFKKNPVINSFIFILNPIYIKDGERRVSKKPLISYYYMPSI